MNTSEEVLKRHVLESNLMEGIRAGPGSPLFDSHLRAAKLADSGKILHPNVLHHALCYEVPEMMLIGGRYRECSVFLGSKEMPPHEKLPELMSYLEHLLREYEAMPNNANLEEAACFIHGWFLCIHPYEDGNGRCARLLWNMLRRNKGLAWHVECDRNYGKYRSSLKRVEAVFNGEYPGYIKN